jgi:hypothetical protein
VHDGEALDNISLQTAESPQVSGNVSLPPLASIFPKLSDSHVHG